MSDQKPDSPQELPPSDLLSRIPGATGRAWRKYREQSQMAQAVADWAAGLPDAAARAWRKGGVRDWLELVRLPNLFTAMADPLAGALILGAGWRQIPAMLAVMLASASLYAAGVVLNDWHDYAEDLRERPHRPLPSGRIGRWRALVGALALMAIGVFWSWLVGAMVVGTLLLLAILAYDILFKQVPIAPVIMGLCRGLNLLLGMSLMWRPPDDYTIVVVIVGLMGVYILGITVIARHEAAPAGSKGLLAGSVLTLVTVLTLLGLRLLFPWAGLHVAGLFWGTLLLMALTYTCTQAVLTPAPRSVQRAVKTGILGVIVFDAALVGFARGPWLTIPVVLLLVPAVWLGRRLYST